MENKMDPYKLAELIFHELKGELSEAESIMLNQWINALPENRALYNQITNENIIRQKIKNYDQSGKEKAWKNLDKKLAPRKKIIRRNFKALLPYAAAASIALLLSTYLLLRQITKSETVQLAESTSTLPGTQKAILTTSENKKITLGAFRESQTFQLKNALATDTNNTLSYLNREAEAFEDTRLPAINTLETARGGEYSLVLSDGTRVFLNSETKLTFPESFTTDTREVFLEGEAYFEVVKDESRAFIVKTGDYTIWVYGTSFNVSAYSSDKKSHTTLIRGSVGIDLGSGTVERLIPGEQACYNKTDHSLNTRKVDTQLYTAWKEGKFMFDDETLEEIMLKIDRWYDTETEYRDNEIRDRHFSGTLNRYENITEILNIISLTTHIEFTMEKNIIYVDKKEH